MAPPVDQVDAETRNEREGRGLASPQARRVASQHPPGNWTFKICSTMPKERR